MAKIEKVHAREVLDSRGNPTLEAEVTLSDGCFGRASVPSGASTGSREALELRDGDKSRFLGKGVLKAVDNVKKIAPALKGKDADFVALDRIMLEMDGTEMKTNLGANAVLGVSMAVCRAAAASEKITLHRFLENAYYSRFLDSKDNVPYRGVTLPTPMMNILNGGKHADNNLSIQEFMIIPSIGRSYKESLRAGVETFHHLKNVLHENKLSTNVGDEGGFAPSVGSNDEALEMIQEAIARAGYRPGQDIFLALDCAASEFRNAKSGLYEMSGSGKAEMDSAALVAYYGELCMKYPIVSIEDGLDEGDWDGWKLVTKELGKKVMLVGDDLFVTNAKILKRGIDEKAANAILIKINQIGSITETLETIALARKSHFNTVVSHRSGETEDTFLSSLAVATDSGLVKTGSASRGERMAKYNELLRIEEELGDKAKFNGLQSLGMKF